MTRPRPPFEVLAAHEPLARLVKRDPTRDGSVPLRVARACVPLLEGNAVGHQLSFRRRLVVRASLGRRELVRDDAWEATSRALGAVLPVLVARGHLEAGGAWARRLERGFSWREGGALRVWTGLLVRPRRGTWLRVAGAGSHASRAFRVRTSFVGAGAFVPLVIDLEDVRDGARLEGEVANVLPVVPDVRAEIGSLADDTAAMQAHARFYDAKYFATKRGEVTRKYRRTIARRDDDEPAAPPAVVHVAHVAGPRPDVVRIARVLGAASTSPATSTERLEIVRFKNAVAFRADFDKSTLDVVPDRAALARGKRAIDLAVRAALGDDLLSGHPGAMLYLTKYFTPHPHGEPHFFVKPWAFTRTPPGWSCVLDGVRGDGYDVMRGVVWTDRFHATPAVFDVLAGRRVEVAEGAPLVEALAVPRRLVEEAPAIAEEPIA